jgi:translation elongation factor EF-Tu-like GTPase
MMRMVSTIEDVFEILGRGLVVIPGVPLAGNFNIKAGDMVRLKRPDGTHFTTKMRGIEMIGRSAEAIRAMPVCLGSDLSKEAVPVGTEIWFDDFK